MKLKYFLKQDVKALGLKEATKNYVNQVLEEENKERFEKQDFELMELYIEDIKNILERLRDRLKMLNFSNLIYYNEVEKFGKSFSKVEEFAGKADKKYYK